jgi:N-acetyl-D-muramate 6-phosphate phosphatase
VSSKAVLFDLDGTLLDTAPDMTCALNSLLAEQGLEPLAFAIVRPYVSHGAVSLVRLAFPEAREEEFNRLRERFLAIYRGCLADSTRLFEGMPELLTTFERVGIPWGIVTNKPTWLTEPLLEALGLHTRAGSVVCGDTFEERKPHPRPLLHAASEIGVAPADCLYVGDAERDIRAARAAEMRSLIARFGYIGPADDIAAWSADGCIDSPHEILQWLELKPVASIAD